MRAALVNAARAYGGHDVRATVMGVRVELLYKAKYNRPSGTLAIRLAAVQSARGSVHAWKRAKSVSSSTARLVPQVAPDGRASALPVREAGDAAVRRNPRPTPS